MPDTCPGCGCSTEPAHADYPHEPGRLPGCPACDASCHCTANAAECVFEGEHNGLAQLNLQLAQDPCPVNVLPGTDYRVVTDAGQHYGWVVADVDDGVDEYEAYNADGQFIGTAASPEAAAALTMPPPVSDLPLAEDGSPSGYAVNTPEHRTWERAQERGKAAASWVFDGNTGQSTYRRVLQGIEDGDPVVLDLLADHEPRLGGDYTRDDLMGDIGWVPHDGTLMRDDLALQFEQEARTAFMNEIERQCLRHLPHGEVDSHTQLGRPRSEP